MTMWWIVVIIFKNQASGGKSIISQAIVDTVRVYIYRYSDEMDEVLKVDLYHMVEEQDALGEARQLRSNLEETQMKMWKNVKSKMA